MPSNPLTIREQVTNRIREGVVAGTYPPDQPLREAELAKRLGVSRGPIRDAFLTLSQEGYLAYQANRGVTVRRPPDPQNRSFIVGLRVQIECHVVSRGFENLAEGGLASIETALADLEAACAGRDVGEVARCDVAFHEAVLNAHGGADLLPIWKWLCSQMMLTYSRLEHFGEIYLEHFRIAEGVRSGNLEACIAALQANIR